MTFTTRIGPIFLTVLCTVLSAVGLNRSCVAGAEHGGEDRQRRFFYNDDGGRAIFLLKGPFHLQQLHAPADVLVGTGVTTLVYCVSDNMANYPSEVASWHDWRRTAYVDKPGNPFQRLYLVTQQLRREGIDPVGVIMERAVEQGLEFIPSLRMNDGHFGQKEPASKHPLTSRFWMENSNLAIVPGSENYPNCVLDFTHEKVRNYRLAQIDEIIQRYAVDGLELDFTRHYQYFPAGRQEPELLTHIVRRARTKLDEKGRKDGRDRILIVRVAHTLERCKSLGCDVPTWITKGLVDYVVPASPDRYFQFDIPLEEFVALAKGTDCRVVASPDSWKATPDMYRAGMCSYYAKGQRDTYLFNFFTPRAQQREYYPFRDEDYALLRDVKSPVTLWGRPKQFGVDRFLRSGRLPLAEVGRAYDIRIFIGEDLAACREAMILNEARLVVTIDGRKDGDELDVALNGQPLPLAGAKNDSPQLGFALVEPLPVVGHNTVSVTLKKLGDPDSDQRPAVTWIDVSADYELTGVEPR